MEHLIEKIKANLLKKDNQQTKDEIKKHITDLEEIIKNTDNEDVKIEMRGNIDELNKLYKQC